MSALTCMRTALALDQLHRREQRSLGTAGAETRGPRGHRPCERRRREQRLLPYGSLRTGRGRSHGRPKHLRPVALDEGFDALAHDGPGVLARARERSLADHLGRKPRLAQQQADRLLEVLRLALLDDEQRALALGERRELGRYQRVGDVENVQRHLRRSEDVREAETLERAQEGVVEAALKHDADVSKIAVVPLVERVPSDELDRGRPALVDLFALLLVGRRRQDDPVVAAPGRRQRIRHSEGRPAVVARDEAAVHVAGADPHHQHHRRVARLGELEPLLDHPHDGGQIRARIEQPHLRLHREGVGALLHDAGALAIVLAEHDQRAARDAGRGEIRRAHPRRRWCRPWTSRSPRRGSGS